MERRQINIIVVVAVMILIIFLLFRFAGRGGGYSWSENYLVENRGPYGTDVIRQLLESYYRGEDFEVMEDSIARLQDVDGPANYIFIGASQYLDSISLEYLFDFIDRGNRAFIISRSLSDELADYAYIYGCNDSYSYYWDGYEELRDTAIDVSLYHEDLEADSHSHLAFQYRNKINQYNWQYIDDQYICDEEYGLASLGTFQEMYTNFARLKYGDGYLYLHTNPLLFSNYALLDEDKLPYIEAVFSHTIEGPIYWDEANKIPGFLRNPRFTKQISGRSPLEYILHQPPLRWAWYLLLIMAGMYLLFRTKRRQRTIPILEKNHNTSLEFLQTIGHLYFLQNDHRKIALHKMRLFLSFIRERYNMATQDLDDAFVRQLSSKSEVSKENINAILLLYRNIESSGYLSAKILVNFHHKIEAFYKNCK